MPNAKRASMREGPLAALFRKTAEDTDESRRRTTARRPPPRAARTRAHQRPTETEASAPAEPTVAPGRHRRVDRPGQAAEPEFEEPRIPLPARAPAPRLLRRHPRERARPSPPRRRKRLSAAREPSVRVEPERRARALRRPRGQRRRRVRALCAPREPAPPRRARPVLRVVGVGGAGVNASTG